MHTFIFTNFATGCPQEWNIFTPLACWYLFFLEKDGLDWHGVYNLPSQHPFLTCYLLMALLGAQVAGSLYPPSNSFLTSMKYYAGNWPCSVWLVKKSAWHKFNKMHTLSQDIYGQLDALGQGHIPKSMMLRVYAFRALHLPYRQLPRLLEIAVGDNSFHDYHYFDGEVICGVLLGYNFGDGNLD